tara:strand:+ start:452 stop:730 length:279 start_codon:yes stop_codon:yes gene_type:complete
MTKDELRELHSEAQKVTQDTVSRLLKTLGEFGYSGDEQIAFIRLAASELVGGAADLFLETHYGDGQTLNKYVETRIAAKKFRDDAEKRRQLN